MPSGKRSLSPEPENEISSVKKKSCQRFRESYASEFPCLRASKKSENMAFCSYCCKDFNIAHGGRDDCRRHVLAKSHIENAKAVQNTREVSSFFKNNDDFNVINAELLFARFIIEHNIPIAAADHSKQLFVKMFPDSRIAKQFNCARTKCSCLIRNMAENTVSDLISKCKDTCFSLSTDGSNDSGDKKLYPFLISYYDNESGEIKNCLLSLLECCDNTGEGIFNILNEEIKKKNLTWEKCTSFSTDNAPNMIGKKKGVSSFLLNKNANIIVRGCPCHLLHIAAKKSTAAFPVDIELFLIDIFYFLDKSSKRQNSFKKQQEICEHEKPHKILKYCATRWLSLLSTIERVLEQWEPLEAFFNDENNSSSDNTRFLKIQSSFRNPKVKLILLFLQSILPLFVNLNMLLQQEAPIIYKVQRSLQQLYMDLLVRFVKPTLICSQETKINYSSKKFLKKEFQKDNENLVIGVKTRMFLKDTNINDKDVMDFYDQVRNFFMKACTYIQEKLLCEDDFLKHAEVADVTIRDKVSFSSILFVIKQFPFLIAENEVEDLEMEFAHYQAETFDTIKMSERMDHVWSEISKLVDYNGSVKYKLLPKIMQSILTVPHSNASCERIFSLVRKNQTDFRPNLSRETLEALLIEKVNIFSSNEECFAKKFSKKELSGAKSSTVIYAKKNIDK